MERVVAKATLRYVHACTGEIHKVSKVITARRTINDRLMHHTDNSEQESGGGNVHSKLWEVSEETRCSFSCFELLPQPARDSMSYTSPQLHSEHEHTAGQMLPDGSDSLSLHTTEPGAAHAEQARSSVRAHPSLGVASVSTGKSVPDASSTHALDMSSMCTDYSGTCGTLQNPPPLLSPLASTEAAASAAAAAPSNGRQRAASDLGSAAASDGTTSTTMLGAIQCANPVSIFCCLLS